MFGIRSEKCAHFFDHGAKPNNSKACLNEWGTFKYKKHCRCEQKKIQNAGSSFALIYTNGRILDILCHATIVSRKDVNMKFSYKHSNSEIMVTKCETLGTIQFLK